jgi:hypothetical protein
MHGLQVGPEVVRKAKGPEGAREVKEASEVMAKLAGETAEEFKCDVYISQAPPRYDDPEGKNDLAKLTEYMCGVTRTAAMFLPRVHTVPQNKLASPSQQEVRYQENRIALVYTCKF